MKCEACKRGSPKDYLAGLLIGLAVHPPAPHVKLWLRRTLCGEHADLMCVLVDDTAKLRTELPS